MRYGIGIPEMDTEGRVITLDMGDYYFVTTYTPNSQSELARLDYRMKWDDAWRDLLCRLKAEKPVIACGDLNVAHTEIDLKILLDTLRTDSPALPKELNDKLFYTVLEDYADIPTKAGKMRKMKVDPFYNAAQVKYAYAVTCHKAQGGQWMNVFLDIGYITEEYLGEDFYRWLYTAFTRATHHLYLVNLPDDFIE